MKKLFFCVALIAGIICFSVICRAEEDDDTYGITADYYDYSAIDRFLREDDVSFDFGRTVRKFFNGDAESGITDMGEALMDTLWGELSAQKTLLIKITIIGIIAALFTNLATAFLSGSTSQTGFYITFMMLMCVLAGGYAVTADMTAKAIDRLLGLMETIVPVYVMSVGFASGSATGAGVYQVIAIIMTMIQNVMLKGVLPMIYIYMIMNFIDNITEGNFLGKACELMKTIINWVMKALMSFVIGLNLIQGMISPVVDNIRTSAVGKALSVVPGVGGALSSVSGVILGAGTLIKNSIGAAAMLAIAAVCFVPALKAAAISIGYKAAGAILEPVSDKRVVNAVNGVYESTVLLAKLLLYSAVFFILTIAVICNSTNMNA